MMINKLYQLSSLYDSKALTPPYLLALIIIPIHFDLFYLMIYDCERPSHLLRKSSKGK